MKELIKIIVDDYKEAKEDIEKNSPQAKWLLLLIAVIYIIAGWIDTL